MLCRSKKQLALLLYWLAEGGDSNKGQSVVYRVLL